MLIQQPKTDVASPDSSPASKMPGEKTKSTHYVGLDGIRGMAIVLTYFAHYGGGRHFSGLAFQVVGQFLSIGWVGVGIFFVLSGFLITGILIDTQNDPTYFKTFYARRSLRIFPVYYAVLFGLAIGSVWLHVTWNLPRLSLFFYVNNIVAIAYPTLYFLSPSINLGHFWSLAVEEQFYLIWPWLVRYLRNLAKLEKLAIWLIVIPFFVRLIVVLSHGDYSASGTLLPDRMDGLAWGALLAIWVRTKGLNKVKVAIPICGLIGSTAVYLTIGLMTHTLSFKSAFMSTVGYTTNSIGAASLVWLCLGKNPISSFFSVPALRFLGKYSYGFYVWHQILIEWVRSITYTPLLNYFHSERIAAIGFFVFGFLINLAIAVISYELFEKQFLNLKTRFAYRSG